MIASRVPIRLRLREYLEQINVTPYALAKAVDMPLPSMYRILRNPHPDRLDSKRLGEFIKALNDMGHPTDIGNLLEYERPIGDSQ